MKKLYITIAFSLVMNINSMERLTPEELDYDTLAKTAEFLIAMTDITDLAMLVNKENTRSESNAQSTSEKSFPCPHCGKKFTRSRNCNQHAITCKQNQNKKALALPEFKCPHPGCTHTSTSKRKYAIYQHAITCKHNPHPDQEALTQFKCTHCGKGFPLSHHRKKHENNCPKRLIQEHATSPANLLMLDDFNKSNDLSAGLRPVKRHHTAACSSHES